MRRRYILHSETGVEPTTVAFQVLEALGQKDARVLVVLEEEFAAARAMGARGAA